MGMVKAPQGFPCAVENHGPEADLVEDMANSSLIFGVSEILYANSPWPMDLHCLRTLVTGW